MSVAVVICAYTLQRWDVLQRAIRSALDEVPDEVVLVADHNDELLSDLRRAWPHLKVVENVETQGLSGARNSGIAATNSDFVAFLDDDAVGRPGWLRHLVAPLEEKGVGVTGGRIEPDWQSAPPRWFPDEFLWVIGCSYRGMPTERAVVRNPIGACMAMRREVFEHVGLFRSGVGRVGSRLLGCEETELAIQAGIHGFASVYEPSAVVDHCATPDRGTARYFVRRCFSEGISKASVARSVGGGEALSTETGYVTTTLPSGVAKGLRQALWGPDRIGGLGRATMIVVGLGATSIGFLRGQLGSRNTRPSVATAPSHSERASA